MFEYMIFGLFFLTVFFVLAAFFLASSEINLDVEREKAKIKLEKEKKEYIKYRIEILDKKYSGLSFYELTERMKKPQYQFEKDDVAFYMRHKGGIRT